MDEEILCMGSHRAHSPDYETWEAKDVRMAKQAAVRRGYTRLRLFYDDHQEFYVRTPTGAGEKSEWHTVTPRAYTAFNGERYLEQDDAA
jgi:hypothetical protein